jgi:hypothetical protein
MYELDNFLCMDHEIDPESIDQKEIKYLVPICQKPATHYIIIASPGFRMTMCYCDEHRQGPPISVSRGEWFMIEPEDYDNWETIYDVMTS